MENKGLFVLLGILVFLFGFVLSAGVMPSKVVENKTIVEVPKFIYVNNTVEVAVQDKDVFNKVYASEISDLEDSSLIAFNDEFSEYDLEDFLEANISGFDKMLSFEEDLDEFDINVINLGLDNEEDKVVNVYKEFKVKYELDNSYDKLKATVVVKGIITFDEHDGFEAKLTYSLK